MGGHFAKAAIMDHGGRDLEQLYARRRSGCSLVQCFNAQHGVLVTAPIGHQVGNCGAFGHHDTSI